MSNAESKSSYRALREEIEKIGQKYCPTVYGWIISHKLFIKYVISGSSSALIDVVLLYFFTDIVGIWYLFSSMLAFLGALIVSFVLQKYWTFRDKSSGKIRSQFLLTAVVALANLGMNTLLMYVLVDVFGFWYILAQFLTGAILALGSFMAYRKIIFRNELSPE